MPSFAKLLALLAAFAVTVPTVSAIQKPLVRYEDHPNNIVPGNDHNITYGPVPESDQLFKAEFIELASYPINFNNWIFILLRGDAITHKQEKIGTFGSEFGNATITMTVKYADQYGKPSARWDEATIPLHTDTFNEYAHLTIRRPNGTPLKYLPSNGTGDILIDALGLGGFMQTGMYTFEIVARAGDEDNTCLFAFTYSQWWTRDRDWW